MDDDRTPAEDTNLRDSSPTIPPGRPAPDGISGDRPRRSLERPPSERYARPSAAGRADNPAGGELAATGLRGILVGVLAGIGGALAVVLVAGVLASTSGLLAIAGATGFLVGLGMRAGGSGGASGGRIGSAVSIAVVALLIGDLGIWVVAISEGGVLGPIDYLGQTLGLLIPAQAVLAALGAWLGRR